MTADFFDEYLKAKTARQLLLAVMNPNKFRTCQFLLQYHEARDDKVCWLCLIVFCMKGASCADNRLLGQCVCIEEIRNDAQQTIPIRQHGCQRAHADSAELSIQSTCQYDLCVEGTCLLS